MSIEILNDASDQLIPNLNFKQPATASYIIDRHSASFHAIGGNVYKPTSGVRLIRFNINSEDFLEPSTLRVMFDIVNTNPETDTLYPVGTAAGFFSRCRILSRGQLVEDIMNYNRVHNMLMLFKSEGAVNDEMFESNLSRIPIGLDESTGHTVGHLQGISAGMRQTVMFRPCFGLLEQRKFISLKYSPLTIELELDSDIGANIVIPHADYAQEFPAAYTSTSWEIQNCIVRCDIVKIDSELQNKYDDHLMSGGSINLKYTTYHSQILKVLGSTFSVNLTRSLTYLTRIYVSFLKAMGGEISPDYWTKPNNCFYHTLRWHNRQLKLTDTVPDYKKGEDMVQSCLVQIGSKIIPDYPLQSSTEAYYFLKKALNLGTVFPNHTHSLSITAIEYLSSKFVMVFDTEKLNGHVASFTGMNVKNGEQITLQMKMQTSRPDRNPEDCHIVLEAEQVLEIKGSYVRVAD